MTAYTQKRGLCSVRVKDNKATIVYLNPYATNTWQTLTVNVNGNTFTGQVYGKRLYAANVTLGTSPGCDFAVSATPANISTTPNGSITLNYGCTGNDCGSASKAWSGNGASGSSSPYTLNAPGSADNYTYTMTLSKSGCDSKAAQIAVAVQVDPPCGGTGLTTNYYSGVDLQGNSLASFNGNIDLPNPNDGEFEARFYVELGRKATLRVSDVQGRQVWQKSLTGQGEHREMVRLPAQSVGTYILLLDKEATVANSKSEYKRVIVVK